MMDKENIRDFNNKSSLDMVSEAHRKLVNLFPEIESDGKIDFQKLKLLFSDDELESTERFGLNWAGKGEAIKTAQSRTSSTLRPIMGDSVDWAETQNLYIEGDNLEILKVIQRSYADSIKLIYLDPPYNTGKDFVYRDNTTQATDDYLEESGQKGEFAYSTNVETNGRFHSTWLSMMYPRLKLVRSLLQDDGVLFVSIDDTEVDNLRKIMDEIFGESNFIAQIIVDGTPKNDPLIVATSHEYILVYTKNIAEAKLTQWGAPNPLTDELNELVSGAESYAEAEGLLKKYFKDNNLQKDNISNYKYVDEKGIFRTGPLDDPQSRGPKDERINIKTGNPLKVPSRGWSSNVQTWNEWVDSGLIYFPDDDDKLPGKKTYLTSDKLEVGRSVIKMQTRKTTNYLKKMFDDQEVFSFPKPLDLIQGIIENANDKNMIVLDAFSGSGTTFDAVMRQNIKDGGNRRVILLQLPEDLDKTLVDASGKAKKVIQNAINFLDGQHKPHLLTEIAKERLRRTKTSLALEYPMIEIDAGFRNFKLDSTNFVSWDNNMAKGQSYLTFNATNIKAERTDYDVLFEIMVKKGLDLSATVSVKEFGESAKVFDVFEGTLFVITGENVSRDAVDFIIESRKRYEQDGFLVTSNVVLIDNAFDNVEEKLNAIDRLKAVGYAAEEIESI